MYIHVMVEELLQLLIAEVYADLFESVEFKNLQVDKKKVVTQSMKEINANSPQSQQYRGCQ